MTLCCLEMVDMSLALELLQGRKWSWWFYHVLPLGLLVPPVPSGKNPCASNGRRARPAEVSVYQACGGTLHERLGAPVIHHGETTVRPGELKSGSRETSPGNQAIHLFQS